MAAYKRYNKLGAYGFDTPYEQRSSEALRELHALMAGPDDFTIPMDDPELKNPNDEFHHPAPMLNSRQLFKSEVHMLDVLGERQV